MYSAFYLAMLVTPMEVPSPDEAIHRYLTTETKRLSERFLDGAKTKNEWAAKRPKLKEQFLEMLGLWPLPEKSPLQATVTGTLERSGVVLEKVHFQSRPGLYVTGNLYRPKMITKRLPTVLYVCGHSGRGRDGNKTAFQDHGLWFATNGYVCLIVDTLQLGEIAAKHHGTYNLNRFWWQARGYTPAGVECWNGIRAIDYLCSRDDVDASRIGVTGISGGGATTVWIAAADERVQVAVPVSGMSDLESYVSNKVIVGHCDCMFAINTYQWEWTTILALFAPKPLLFANSDNDPIFPMDGNRRIVERLRRCYALLDAKDRVDEYVSKGNHDYRPDLRVAIFGFFNKHLAQTNNPVKDADFPAIDGKDLRVFPDELPKDQRNDSIDESFVRSAKPQIPFDPASFGARKQELLQRLRTHSFRPLPSVIPALAQAPTLVKNGPPMLFVQAAEDGVPCYGIDLVQTPKSTTRTILILNQAEEAEAGRRSWEMLNRDVTNLVALWPRGHGPARWTTKNPPNTVERSFALLGQTADSGRVRDVASMLAGIKRKEGETLRLVGRGPAGIIAAYAALFVPGVATEVVVIDPPASHREGPYFLNVLRVTDIPEALGLLANDTKLTLVNAKDKAFDTTAAYYKAAGKEVNLQRR